MSHIIIRLKWGLEMDKGIGLTGADKEGPYHVEKSTKDMAIAHKVDTLEYNLRHAEEHLQKARESCRALDKASPGHTVPISKEMLDLFDYFEQAVGHKDSDQTKADKKLKNYIHKTY